MRAMAGKRLELAVTGSVVAANVKERRTALGLNYTELSERLAAVDRDIPPLAVRRIEEGNRRVDVDDLTSLAVTLGVSPTTLLMPTAESGSDKVSVTGLSSPLTAAAVWDWLRVEEPLDRRQNIEFFLASWPEWYRAKNLLLKLSHYRVEQSRRLKHRRAQKRVASDGDD